MEIIASSLGNKVKGVFNKIYRDTEQFVQSIKEYRKLWNKSVIYSWGADNKYIINLMDQIKCLPLLQQAIELKCSLLKGKRIYVYELDNTDGINKEKHINDDIASTLFEKNNLQNYLEQTSMDYEYAANVFVLVQLNTTRDKIVGIVPIPAHTCRYEAPSEATGQHEYIWTSHYFTSGWKPASREIENELVSNKIVQKFRILDPLYPEQTIKKYKNDNWFVYHIKNYTPGNLVYGENALHAAYNSGWMDISKGIPALKKQAIESSMNIKYHIQYDIDYFRNEYGLEASKSIETVDNIGRTDQDVKAKIQAFQSKADATLSGTAGYDKALYTPRAYRGGVEREAVKITELKNNIDGKFIDDAMVAEYMLIQSTGVHPVLLGGGLPGTTSGGGQSGSSQRVAMDVLQVSSEATFQKIMQPFRIAYLFNGGNVNRYFGRENTKISTLDVNADGTSSISQIN